MRFGHTALVSALILTATMPALASPHARRGPTSPRLFGRHVQKAAVVKPVSQRAIDPERTTQIQAALIKRGYLTGEPTGHWDNETQAALEKIQGENGWQTKFVPDSRAIIKLGLGPGSPAPETSSNSSPAAPAAESEQDTFPAQQ